MSSILSNDIVNKPEGNPMSDTVETTPGAVKKIASSVSGAASTVAGKAKDTASSAASTVNDKVREHGPKVAGKVKSTAVKAAQHDRTKAVAGNRYAQLGLLGAVLAVVTFGIVRRRRQA